MNEEYFSEELTPWLIPAPGADPEAIMLPSDVVLGLPETVSFSLYPI